jgi:putative membrane protein
MDPQLEAFLLSWDFRLDLILLLAVFGIAYTVGWVKLRLKKARIANGWRLASYYTGLVLLAIALFSGLDVFQTQLFFMHMIQHLFLLMFAPPLLLLANPMVFILWALPRIERQQVGRLLRSKSRFRRTFVSLTNPWMVWLVYTINLIVWHDPNPYEAAIESDLLHDIEHFTFFYAGMGLWWHVTGAAPKFHGRRSYPMRMLLIVASFFVNLFVGVLITLSPDIIYTYYESVPRIWGISVEDDQRIGGLLMWIPGGMMYLMTFLILGANLVAESERRARLGDRQRKLKFEGASQ